MKRNALLLLAGLLAAGLIAGGCGDDDDDGNGGDALTKQEFIAQADALCSSEDQKVDQAAEQLGKNASQAEQQAFITATALPNIQVQIDGIRDLGAPEGEEDQVNDFLDTAQEALDRAEANPSLFTGEQGRDPFAETRQLALDLGLKKCAQ
jgi:hypothetical protein